MAGLEHWSECRNRIKRSFRVFLACHLWQVRESTLIGILELMIRIFRVFRYGGLFTYMGDHLHKTKCRNNPDVVPQRCLASVGVRDEYGFVAFGSANGHHGENSLRWPKYTMQRKLAQ